MSMNHDLTQMYVRHVREGEHPRVKFARSAPVSEKGGYVYILTNTPNGPLYIGVTSNIHKRMHEHREGIYEGFSKRYGLKRLVYWEKFDDIRNAIAREKQLKHFNRAWKVGLILQGNSAWEDLYDDLCS